MKKITRNSIVDKISKGKTDIALEEILFILPQAHETYNKFILLKGQWSTAETQMLLGLNSRSDLALEFNRVSNATLEFLKNVEQDNFNQEINDESQKEKVRTQILKFSQDNLLSFNYDIFFCFSNKNIIEARKICDELRGYGLQVFFSADDLRLKGGHQFSKIIDEALENSRHFLLYCTEEAMKSEWVNVEYTSFHDQIHISDSVNRKFLIFEGSNFSQNSLRITYRNNQRVKHVSDVLGALLPEYRNIIENRQNSGTQSAKSNLDIKGTSEDKKVIAEVENKVRNGTIIIKKISSGWSNEFACFDVYCDGNRIGDVCNNNSLTFEMPVGKHNLKVSYEYQEEYDLETLHSNYQSGESDTFFTTIDEGTNVFVCGYERIATTFLGLVKVRAGHKLYINHVS